MIETRLLQLQSRLLEGEHLTSVELLELEQARRNSAPMARLLQEDKELHAELLALHRIDATQDDFVRRCQLAAGAVETVEKVPGVFGEKAVTAPVLVADFKLELGDRTDRRLRSRVPRQPAARKQILGWLSAAAAIVLVALGAWWWSPGIAELPATVAVTEVTPDNPSTDEIRRDELKTALVERHSKNGVKPKQEIEKPPAVHIIEMTPGPETLAPKLPDKPSSDLTQVASLQFSPESVWKQRPDDAGSFPATYGLRSGIAELVLTDGTRLVFQGPTNFTMESPRRMRVEDGQMRIEPVSAEDSFSVATPTVWLNGPDNLLAYLNVRPAEGTMVQVEKGELLARPWANDRESEILLSENELDRGIFGPAWREDSMQPATAVAVNDQGKFKGIVDAANRPLSITSPAVFDRILNESRTMIREDGQQFPQQWQGMVDGLEEAVTKMDLQFDNKSVRAGTAGEMLDQIERIREQMISGVNGAGGNAAERTNQSSGFSGVINVNGREQRFSNPAEFQAAQSKMFGPMAGQMMFGSQTDSPGQLSSAFQNVIPGPRKGNSNSSSSFSGMINNNGQSIEFTSPEEFNRAMQQFNRR